MFSRFFIFLVILVAFSAPTTWAKKYKRKIIIKDKITMMTHPLMIKATSVNNTVSFSWSEPHWEFKYFLEIYRKGVRKPIGVFQVKGGKKKMTFKKKKDYLFWRVSAVSKHGNKSPNKKMYKIPLNF